MDIQLKPIAEQVMVITGASSGIGLVTAKRAGARGARVVLAARNERDLARAVEDIRAAGGRAAYVVADVADPERADAIADAALGEFGQIDTWVNNAGVALYGRVMDVSVEDMRRQFDVLYWGEVYGMRAAVSHMRARGGAIINVASALSDRAVPLQGNYAAAKHALKAFTDALRMELEKADVPISITLVKPGSIDTPLFDKAKSYLGVEPKPIPPVYAPEVVAETIIHCAQHPVREIVAGGMGKMLSVARQLPRGADEYMERTMFESQRTDKAVADRPNNLYEPVANDGGERGSNWTGRTRRVSLYTAAALHPRRAAAVAALGVGALAAVVLGRGRRGGEESAPPRE
ncbi:MAG TPA: SDR family oxidoreductase [Gemmatimonadaceae bacterium]